MIISFPPVALNTPQSFKLFGIIPTWILFTLMVLSVSYLMDINNRAEWVYCPVCGNKTRAEILSVGDVEDICQFVLKL